jgi:hypothetical protein
MAKKFKHPNREAWLLAANVLLDKHVFGPVKRTIPKETHVTSGWPSVRSLSAKKRRIGECWDKSTSKDKHANIIISLKLDDPVEVLDVLVHEDVHAIVGNACGHKGDFAVLARRVGLEGPLTATHAGDNLKLMLKSIAKELGPYPHCGIDVTKHGKKQTTRMIKCECCECGYTARTTAKWINEKGTPICPCNERHMEVTR